MNKMRIPSLPSFGVLLLAVCCTGKPAKAQYFYKDIVVTAQINGNYTTLRNNRVSRVTITPSALEPGQNLVVLQQTVYPSQNLVVTYTKVPDAPESWLKSYHNAAGLLQKTVDSSADVVTTSLYEYDAASHLVTVTSNSVPVNDPPEKEVHQWTYTNSGQPVQLIKIKDNADTTFVTFALDEQGNTGEEKAVHKKSSAGTTYYYYDAQKRVTDVARFNERANRILPDYMFEYNDRSQVTQMIVVPEGSADYQTWKYVYDEKGLKQKDICYNKQKQLVASIDYAYTFGK